MEGEKQGQSKVIVSCSYLEENWRRNMRSGREKEKPESWEQTRTREKERLLSRECWEDKQLAPAYRERVRLRRQKSAAASKKWSVSLEESSRRHEVRGPAGAVKYETRDLGIMWPQRHTLLFEVQVAQDLKKCF